MCETEVAWIVIYGDDPDDYSCTCDGHLSDVIEQAMAIFNVPTVLIAKTPTDVAEPCCDYLSVGDVLLIRVKQQQIAEGLTRKIERGEI
jgi:hypothetical protein